MLLKDFDLDLPYIYDEQNIQKIMLANCITHNEATRMDYAANWKQNRRTFNIQTQCITSMYRRLFGNYKNEVCKKIIVECVNEISNSKIRYIGGVCEVQIAFDIIAFNSKKNHDKKIYALQKLFEGICKVVDFEKWDLKPFLNVKEQIIASNYTNEWYWKKPIKSPDQTTSAQIMCVHDVEAINFSVVFCDSNERIISKTHLVSEQPNEWTCYKHLGKLEWLSNNKIVLKNKSENAYLFATI